MHTRKVALQNYPGAIIPGADVLVGGMRFYIATFADFLRRTRQRQAYDPGLEQGLHVQEVIEMAAESVRTGRWNGSLKDMQGL